MRFHPLPFGFGRLAAGVVLFGLLSSESSAEPLYWGANGAGGSGEWGSATPNWWNGSTNVTWTSGNEAIFAGTGGDVTAWSSAPVATGIVFDAPGYVITGGQLNAYAPAYSVTANHTATINARITSLGSEVFVKGGAAMLTIANIHNFGRIQVDAGELAIHESAIFQQTDFTLADAPGTTLTFGPTFFDSVSVKTITGGGSAGGVLRPTDEDRTVTISIAGTGVFRGIAQDNGSGKLALRIAGLGDRKSTTLTAANTYSGSTDIDYGDLALVEGGSILNSAVSIRTRGVLMLGNSTVALGDRISDSLEVTMQGGEIALIGNGVAAAEEQAGALKFSGAVTVSNNQQGGTPSLLTFSAVSRQSGGTIDFSGSGRTKWNGMANDASGIIGAYATAGNEWAVTGADGRVDALASYAADINAVSMNGHVKIAAGGTSALAASAVRSTLNLQNGGSEEAILDLGGNNTLTLSGGGILSSGSASHRIQNGTLLASNGELVVTNRNHLTIDSAIGQAVPGTGLSKSGSGTLTLAGINTYSGDTIINEGRIVVSSDANLGTGAAIRFNGGVLEAAQSFTSVKSLMHETGLPVRIDTGDFDVAFAGGSSSLQKSGAGTLTLNHPNPGSVTVLDGTLVLPNATAGNVSLRGGSLLASGTLTSIEGYGAGTFDIGGAEAATLTVGSFSLYTLESLTVRFDLGAGATDLWRMTSRLSLGDSDDGMILFDFHDLGGTVTGTTYTLIDASASPNPPVSEFGISPEAATAGWSGTFSLNMNDVQVTFTSTPEPGSAALLLLGGALLGMRRRVTRGDRGGQP